MKKIAIVVSILTTFSMADMILGGEINLGFYTHAPKGSIEYQGSSIDIEDTLNWESSSDMFVGLYFEHPIPIVPNIKIARSTFGHEGSGDFNRDFEFGGKGFISGNRVTSGLDFKITDLTLYYELSDNWVTFDFGVTGKQLNGDVYIKSPLNDERTTFDTIIPLGYLKARFDIPITNLALQIEGNYIGYEDTVVYDIEAGVRYTVMFGIGAEVGYKQIKFKLDDIEGFNMDSDFSGFYGKVVWDF